MDLHDLAEAGTQNGSSGGGPDAPPQPPPRPSGPGLRPALLVLGLAVAIVVVFGVFAAVTNVGNGTPSSGTSSPVAVPGTSLEAVPAATALRPLQQAGEPPANIVDSLRLPAGSTAGRRTDNGAGLGSYDQQMTFSVKAAQAPVIQFFRIELARHGWGQRSSGPEMNHPDAIEVLGQKGGDDGSYWEAGAVVSPTRFAADGSESTRFVIRLFQVSDDL